MLRIERCWATPTSDPYSNIQYTFISDRSEQIEHKFILLYETKRKIHWQNLKPKQSKNTYRSRLPILHKIFDRWHVETCLWKAV